MCTHNVNKNNQRYCGKEHAGHKSKSGQPVRPYSTCSTLFLLFVQQTYQNLTRICSFSLVHRIHGWAVPQDNRMVYQMWSNKNI